MLTFRVVALLNLLFGVVSMCINWLRQWYNWLLPVPLDLSTSLFLVCVYNTVLSYWPLSSHPIFPHCQSVWLPHRWYSRQIGLSVVTWVQVSVPWKVLAICPIQSEDMGTSANQWTLQSLSQHLIQWMNWQHLFQYFPAYSLPSFFILGPSKTDP